MGPIGPAAVGPRARGRKWAKNKQRKSVFHPCARADRANDPVSRGMLSVHLCAHPWGARCSCGGKRRVLYVSLAAHPPGLGQDDLPNKAEPEVIDVRDPVLVQALRQAGALNVPVGVGGAGFGLLQGVGSLSR